MNLPVSSRWYASEPLKSDLFRITEPHVHPIFSANIHLVRGETADLVIDSGMGVAPLLPEIEKFRTDPERPLICLSTHSHVDHIGAAHEFNTRLVHPAEAGELAAPSSYSLDASGFSQGLRQKFLDAGYPPLWPLLINALPHAGYDPASWHLTPAPATGFVEDGDMIDLGGWQAEVLHLPGHSPGQVGLFHHDSGTLFGADAVYDGPLIYEGVDACLEDYIATLRRIAGLPVREVHGGHDPAFGAERLTQIIEHYLRLWNA